MNWDLFKDTEDLGEGPHLVLALEINRYGPDAIGDAEPIAMTKVRDWQLLRHQCAGSLCHQRYLQATVLTPKSDAVRSAMEHIDRRWIGSDASKRFTPLNTICEYRYFLRGVLNVDCNHSYLDFEEAFYPIDCTPRHLETLASDVLPPPELGVFFADTPRGLRAWKGYDLAGSAGYWKLLILGGNSD